MRGLTQIGGKKNLPLNKRKLSKSWKSAIGDGQICKIPNCSNIYIVYDKMGKYWLKIKQNIVHCKIYKITERKFFKNNFEFNYFQLFDRWNCFKYTFIGYVDLLDLFPTINLAIWSEWNQNAADDQRNFYIINIKKYVKSYKCWKRELRIFRFCIIV